MVRDRRDPRPCLLSLLYPMLDDRLETPSSFESTAKVVFARGDLQLAWCAPGRATDLSDLPETFVAVAQLDQPQDEGIDFAHRLIAAGVPVDLHHYARAFHAWDRFAATSALARAFEQTWRGFLHRRLHG